MTRHAVRIISVALPILLIFLLPFLGVGSGLGFTILIALLFAFPLFAFEFGTQEESSDPGMPPPWNQNGRSSSGVRDASNTPGRAVAGIRRRRVRNGNRLRPHE